MGRGKKNVALIVRGFRLMLIHFFGRSNEG